ncbi:MAG: hypothetical protein QW524_03595 [Candidatus Woesearchaeota archaeon]
MWQIYLLSKIVLQFVTLVIALLAFRLYYFLKDRRSLFLSIAFSLLFIYNLVTLFNLNNRFVFFLFGINVWNLLSNFFMVGFVLTLILAILNPHSVLEWAFLSFLILVSIYTNLTKQAQFLFTLTVFLTLLIISASIFIHYLNSPSFSKLFLFGGIFLLAVSFAFQYNHDQISQLFDVLSLLSFFVYSVLVWTSFAKVKQGIFFKGRRRIKE